MAKPGLSRGSISDRRFIEDAANNYIVEAFVDVSAIAPGSGLPAATDEQQYIVDAGSGSELGGWGTITGLTDKCIIKYNATAAEWQVVFAPVAAEQGATAYDKDSDTIFSFDGADWNIASGAGGGVKNFAQSMASGYKVGDWTTGNNATFGTAGSFAGSLDVETTSPLDGKKSFKYTAAAGSQNDWVYFTVDISEYARGGAIAYTFDYTWDGEDDDIEIEIWDPTITNEYSNDLNLLKDTTNDYKLSRNTRTIYAHPDTESQVIVGFHVKGAVSGGEELIFDNLKVTDDIGVIGSSSGTEFALDAAGLSSGGTDNASYAYNFLIYNVIDPNYNNATGEYTIQESGTYQVEIGVGVILAGTADGRDITTGFQLNGVDKRQSIQRQVNPELSYYPNGVWSLELNEGDVIRPFFRKEATSTFSYNNPSDGRFNFFHLRKVHTSDAGLRSLTIPNGEKLRDSFNVKVPLITVNGTYTRATLLGQGLIDPYELIVSVSRGGAGGYTVNINPIFTSTPIYAAVSNQTSNTIATAYDESTTGCQVLVENSTSGTNLDGAFSLSISRPNTTADVVGVPVSIQGQTHEQDSYISVTGHNGYGSTATRIPRFATIRAQRGDAFTFLDDATDSTRIIINTPGVYALSVSRGSDGGGAGNIGFSLNADAFVTTDVEALGEQYRLTHAMTPGGNSVPSATWVGYLNAGDVVRPHGDQQVPQNFTYSYLSVAKIGTQPLLDGGLVEQPGLSMALHRANESSNTHVLTWEDITYGSNNDMFKYVQDTTNGDYFEILEDGVFHFHASIADTNGSPQEFGICVNAPAVTFSTINANFPELVIAQTRTPALANSSGSCSGSRRLYRGDRVTVQYQGSLSLGNQNEHHFSCTYSGQTVKYSSRVYKEDPIAWQEKILGSDVTTNIDIADLQFNNLEIGKTYRITGQVDWRSTAVDNADITFRSGPTATGTIYGRHTAGWTNASGGTVIKSGINIVFTAVSTTMYANTSSIAAGTVLRGGDKTVTFIQLEELPFHAQTSKWT